MNMKTTHFRNSAKGVLRAAEAFVEIVILMILYYLMWRYGYDTTGEPSYTGYGKYVLTGVYGILVWVLFACFDGLKFGHFRASGVLFSQGISLFIVNFISYWQLCLIENTVIKVTPMLQLFLGDLVVALVCTLIYSKVYHRLYGSRNMAMIFGKDAAVSLKFKMETRPDKYRIVKLISIDDGLESICEQIVNYDSVIINDVPAEIRNKILKFCYQNGIRTYLTPKLSDIIVRGATSINLFDTPLLLVRGMGLTISQRFFKRMMDLIIAIPVALISAPIMLIVALAIKCEDGGPVFYKQERVTRDGRPFTIIKFRSMIVDAEKNGVPQLAQEKDPRITKVGAFIRATRLDELPQIFNILKGDMSVVGPRPERQEYIDQVCEETPEFVYRLKVKGGLTGYAQVYGKYNTTPYDKLRMDMIYIENYSLFLDIKLLLMTLRIMLTKESTEGIDKAEENKKLAQELADEVKSEK